MQTPNYELLDDVLNLVNEYPSGFWSFIAEKLMERHKGLKYQKEVLGMLDTLYHNHYVNGEGYRYRITFEGKVFLESGGYKAELKRKRQQDIWVVVKIIAGVLNALLALGVAVYATYIAWLSYDLQQRSEKYEQKLEVIQTQIDSLKNQSDKK